MKLTFLGAAQTVTGSKYWLQYNQKNYLIDCGLFQGLKDLRLRNWQALPISARDIDAVILTHAHIDHSGYLPLLVKQGFRGKIYATQATTDLCKVLLPDSGFLQEEEAKHANKYGYSKHRPALPLYTQEEALTSLDYFHPVNFLEKIKLDENLFVTFYYVGHILGASFVVVEYGKRKIMFSGDVGRLQDSIMYPPVAPPSVDYLVLESTYGDRQHESSEAIEQLRNVVLKTIARGGTILIPAFAVGRAQHILYYLFLLKLENKIPDIPVFLDSPMSVDATELFYRYHEQHRLDQATAAKVCKTAQYINSVDESKRLDTLPLSKIIISASGMLEGGRVLHHLMAYAGDPKNTILLTGYQAAGTRGEALLHGKRQLRCFGEEVNVLADVVELNNMSAHADYQELTEWLKQMPQKPHKIFLTHGESHAIETFAKHIDQVLNCKCETPQYLQTIDL